MEGRRGGGGEKGGMNQRGLGSWRREFFDKPGEKNKLAGGGRGRWEEPYTPLLGSEWGKRNHGGGGTQSA